MNKKQAILKKIKGKLEKASAAHAGQAKALGKVIDKKKMLVGGLLTKGIKTAYKAYRKAGGKKTSEIVKESKVSRSIAKDDVKSGLRREIKAKIPFKHFHINSPHLIKSKRRMIIKDLNKLK